MSAPLDLDAIRNQPPPDGVAVWEVGEPQMLALLAEVERLRAESVPRSSLVQVGKWKFGHDRCEAVYVIREDTDA